MKRKSISRTPRTHKMKKFDIRRIKLTREERAIENALLRGEYVPGTRKEFREISQALARRRKNVVISIRVNNGDLDMLKARAKRHGVKLQTFITEFLQRVARS